MIVITHSLTHSLNHSTTRPLNHSTTQPLNRSLSAVVSFDVLKAATGRKMNTEADA